MSHSTKRDWRYYRNLLLVVVLGLGLGSYFGFPIFEANRRMHPRRFPIGSISPIDLGMSYSDVTLTTRDGLSIRGWYVPSTNGAAVILVHAFNGNRTGTLYHAALLAEHGYGVLLYDTRSQGESEGGLYAWGWDAHWDVIAALEYLQKRPKVEPDRIGVLGLSAGGAISLRAAAETEEIAAVVAEGSGWPTMEDWRIAAKPMDVIWVPAIWGMYTFVKVFTGIHNPMPIKQAVGHIAPRPLLLIAAGEDRVTNQGYYDAAGDGKSYWDRDESGHIDALFKHPEGYEERVIGFFELALLRSD